MQYLPWICAGFLVLLICLVVLCTLPKREPYEMEHTKYRKSLYYKSTRNNYNQVASDPGLYGEYQITCLLERCARDAKFLHNLYVPYGEKTTEIDILMIHPVGVFVIESKNFRGKVIGNVNEKMWTQRVNARRETLYNPLKQNNTHVHALQQHLGQNINYHPMVVFGNQCKLRISGKTRHPVLQQKQLLRQVNRIIKYGYTPMTKTKINEIYRQLKPYTQVSEEQKAEHAVGIEKSMCRCPVCHVKFPAFTKSLHRGAKFEVICPECNNRIMMHKED